MNNYNSISSFAYNLYMDKKLLNSILIKKNIHNWVDIVFGKYQLPKEEKEIKLSYNIFSKLSYEKKINFEKKIDKYLQLLKENKLTKKRFFEKMRGKLDITSNFGMTPKQILKKTNIYIEENKIVIKNELNKAFSEQLIYFKKLSTDEYLFIKDITKKEKSKIRTVGLYTFKNKKLSENKIYSDKQINLLKKYKSITIELKNKNKKIPLYNPCYSISYLYLKTNKTNKKMNDIAILTCRYLGNYFNVQTNEKNVNIYCEDLVTCIKGSFSLISNYFYTGLFNGKLIEWEINSNLEINEIKSIYSHQASITVIELNFKLNIIITASEDKYIHIRKQYDLELLTAINLIYCFANPIISRCNNIFPSLIKVSNLNLLYVLIYDLDNKCNFIRGYNMNGLFFAQTEKRKFSDGKNKNFVINSISFTKNSNLFVGFYNLNKCYLLNAWDLKQNDSLKDLNINDKKERDGTQMIEYNYSSNIFNILYDKDFIIKAPNEYDNLENY